MESNRDYILALETAIEGGSISIWNHRQGIEVANFIGDKGVSKAEDILENIFRTLAENWIDKNNLLLVVLATQVGSSTGLKIGEATAKGLAKSLGCRYSEISLWEVLVATFAKQTSQIKSNRFLLPAGKDRVIVRSAVEGRFYEDSEIINLNDDVIARKESVNSQQFIYEGLTKILMKDSVAIPIRRNLAGYIGEVASDNEVKIAL